MSTDRKIDPGIHLTLSCLYSVYKTWDKYPHEIADIMQRILDLEKRHYNEERGDNGTA